MKKEKPAKKPYRPPKIRTERVYERCSLACGKLPLTTADCVADPLSS